MFLWDIIDFETCIFKVFEISVSKNIGISNIKNLAMFELNNSLICRLLMVHGSSLIAHVAGLVAHGPETIGPRARGLETQRQFFLGHEP